MKYVLTALILSVIALLCSCASIEEALQPKVKDPTVAATDAAAISSKEWVGRFLKHEQANPTTVGLDAKQAAKGLRERYDGNMNDLRKMKEAYQLNPTDANLSRLKSALEMVLMDQALAQGYLGSTALPQRGQGAPFAPLMMIAPPGSQPTALDTIFERLGGLQAQIQAIEKSQAADRLAIGKLGYAVWSITNQTTVGSGTATNKEPPKP